jgi:hypothetical protein
VAFARKVAVRRLGGQAARGMWAVLRRLLAFALGALVVLGAGFGVLAWWAAERPIEMPWLAARIEAADSAGSRHLSVGMAALAWEGFRDGLGSPIDIRLTNVVLHDPADGLRVEAPRVQVMLELGPLLRGRVRPRSVAIFDARVALTRTGAPSVWRLDVNTALRELAGVPDSRLPLQALSGLRRAIVRNAIVAAPPGQGWAVERLDADLARRGDGGADASADLTLTIGGAPAQATLRVTLPGVGDAVLHGTVGRVRLASLATLWPALAGVAPVLDAPIDADAELRLGGDLAPQALRVALRAGAGTLRTGDAPVTVTAAHLAASWQPGHVSLDGADLDVRPSPDRPPTHLTARGAATLGADGASGTLTLGLDRLAFDDLAALWPAWWGRDGRSWAVENVTAGLAHDGHLALGFIAPAGLSAASGLRLTSATGSLAGSDLTTHWLRPLPPAEHGEAVLRVLDPDTLRVDLGTARQAVGPSASGNAGTLSVQGGSVLVSGLTQRDQAGVIRVRLAGTIPDALALLSQPRLHLLSAHPVPLKDPRGQVTADVLVTLPLVEHVADDQVSVLAEAHLTDFHLAAVAAGRPLDAGDFNLTATEDGLTLNGSGRLADIPARISGAVDFRAGPPTQVQQRFTVAGRAQASALAAAGLDSGGLLSGAADLNAVYTQRRNGDADIDVRAGLTDAELRLPPLGWRKPVGDAAAARARLVLDGAGRLSRIDAIEVDGEGIAVRGQAVLASGGDVDLTLGRLVLGGTTAQGTVRFLDDGRTIHARLSGPRLDLSGRFAQQPGAARAADTDAGDRVIDASFDRVALARRRLASNLRLHAETASGLLRNVRLSALTGPGQLVEASVEADRGGRTVQVRAADGGAVLRDLGALDSIEGGRLSLRARFLDQRPGRPLSGVAELDDFKVRGAPLLAKALQAVTLYGLVQAVEGPGMTFTHLAAPFAYGAGVLELNDARAFNPSLGLTAKGRVDFNRDRLVLEGTIVPAYFLNTVLGRIPLIGRLFSPEKGGGVIAARYSAEGSIDDPEVRVNPLSALTPGFLRGLFGR